MRTNSQALRSGSTTILATLLTCCTLWSSCAFHSLSFPPSPLCQIPSSCSSTIFTCAELTPTRDSSRAFLSLHTLKMSQQASGASAPQVMIDHDGNEVIFTPDEMFPVASHMTINKFLTMQDKRVVVTIRYSGWSGLRSVFLTAAKRIKSAFPDVLIEKRILDEESGDGTFEILVDGKLVTYSKSKNKENGNNGVFVSMQELGIAISKARKRRRPSTLYSMDAIGSNPAAMRLDVLRKSRQEKARQD
mmetsp:Transcript_3050/g.4586  ORF Transcript_3050/g.4586 Transcript_3050/m.4586 type:complete len:247 (-) Transcript_3050:17-757(-)